MTDSPLVVYSRMIKLSHSIFALPFAFAAAVLASRQVEVTLVQLLLILWCMVCARSSAMGFNRIIDRDIDAANPRTAGREIPAGQISLRQAWLFTVGSAFLFAVGAWMLSALTGWLSPIALAVIWGYSLSKRYTWLCHLILGLALALAPTAVWIALTGSFGWVPLLLSLSVGSWVAGFDIIYSCQDAEFDASEGLYSLPASMGVKTALVISALLHLITAASLAALPFVSPMGWPYWVGFVLIVGVLCWEHAIVKPDDFSRVNKAFFDLNGYVSLLFFFAVWFA
jgi:4-hydroxybenzoate polyprenyltransferase